MLFQKNAPMGPTDSRLEHIRRGLFGTKKVVGKRQGNRVSQHWKQKAVTKRPTWQWVSSNAVGYQVPQFDRGATFSAQVQGNTKAAPTPEEGSITAPRHEKPPDSGDRECLVEKPPWQEDPSSLEEGGVRMQGGSWSRACLTPLPSLRPVHLCSLLAESNWKQGVC